MRVNFPADFQNSTIELLLSAKAKEKLAIIDSKYGSLFEANHSTANSNDCLGFEKKSESVSSIRGVHPFDRRVQLFFNL